MKFPVANMSELRKIEAGIGFTSGILVGALSAGVFILFFTDWEWYFKLFSGIGSAGIIGSLYMALSEQIKARRGLLLAISAMDTYGEDYANTDDTSPQNKTKDEANLKELETSAPVKGKKEQLPRGIKTADKHTINQKEVKNGRRI